MPRCKSWHFCNPIHVVICIQALIAISISSAQDISFMAYNLRNFLESDVYKNGEKAGTRYKPEEEINALVDIITEVSPDILGLCEIGNTKDLKKLKTLLTAEGLDYPYMEHVDAADSVRHLALLSKYPLKSKSHTSLTYSIGDKKYPLRRGLLHVEIQIEEKTIHAMGVHLKSKRPAEYADQATMRLNEAFLVRQQADQLLRDIPNVKLFLYGDFNDTFKSETLRTIKGNHRSDLRLEPLDLKASDGSCWTYYWDYQRVYSAFDYILCSRAMLDHVDFKESSIYDSPSVLTASDHRPLILSFSL